MMQVEFEAHMLILAACCDYFREVLLPTGIGTPGEHHGGNPPETNAAASTAPGGAAGKRRVLVDVGGVKVTAPLSDRASIVVASADTTGRRPRLLRGCWTGSTRAVSVSARPTSRIWGAPPPPSARAT